MKAYLDILQDIRVNGVERSDRTGTGTLSIFGPDLTIDMERGFPLLTTKKVFYRSVIYELLWFLRGEDNIKYLHDNNVHIWDVWADADGYVGPMYGYQWRHWTNANGKEIDQIAKLVEGLKKDPFSRRHILNAWNVGDLEHMHLPPCHVLSQYYVGADGTLSCKVYQRSADFFLGVPFDIASYAFLLSALAQILGLRPKWLKFSFGDAHIYLNHLEQVDEQLSREPKALPTLRMTPGLTSLDDLGFMDFQINDYNPDPFIKAPISK